MATVFAIPIWLRQITQIPRALMDVAYSVRNIFISKKKSLKILEHDQASDQIDENISHMRTENLMGQLVDQITNYYDE